MMHPRHPGQASEATPSESRSRTGFALVMLLATLILTACDSPTPSNSTTLRHYVCDGDTWTEVSALQPTSTLPHDVAAAATGDLVYVARSDESEVRLLVHEAGASTHESTAPLEPSSSVVDVELAWVEGVIHITALDEAGAIHHGTYENGAWGTFRTLASENAMTSPATSIAVASQNNLMHLCVLDSAGSVFHTLHDGDSWLPARRVSAHTGHAAITCAAFGDTLYLLAVDPDGSLWQFNRSSTWYAGVHILRNGIDIPTEIHSAFVGPTQYLVELTQAGRLAVTTWQGGAWGASSPVPIDRRIRDFTVAATRHENSPLGRLFLCTVSD